METNVYKALKLLLYQCERGQYNYSQMLYTNAGIMVIVNEFCTVRSSCGRRAGHTHALLHIIADYFKNDNVVFVGMVEQNRYVKEIWDEIGDPDVNIYFVSPLGLIRRSKLWINIDAVFVDNITLLEKEFGNSIKEGVALMARANIDKEQPFYFVGVQ